MAPIAAAHSRTLSLPTTSYTLSSKSQINKGDGTSWFHDPSWMAGECEADSDIATGRVTIYENSDDFLAAL